MQTMKKESYQKYRAVNPKKSGKRRIRPIYSALLCGILGLGGGFGGGYLAVKNYMPEQTAVNTSIPLSDVSITETSSEDSSVIMTTASNVKSIQDVIEDASKTVVEIQVEIASSGYGMFGGSSASMAAGSGVIISEDGYIITNNHVIEDASKVTVTTYDGTTYDAEIIGSDAQADIGVIKIEAQGLDAAVIGDSDTIRVGDTALVIGNPLGTLGGTVTSGIISAVNREMTINNQLMNLIQTNAEINSGNSGGGLFNGDGNLIGIVNAKDSGMTNSGTVIEGLGFAIPINTAITVANDLIQNGHVTSRATIGVGLQTAEQDYAQYKAGVYIAKVYEGSAAEAAGLMEGDRIIRADDTDIETYTQLSKVLSGKHVGDTMTVAVERDGRELEFTLTLTRVLDSMQQY